jgi:hypothetical protein
MIIQCSPLNPSANTSIQLCDGKVLQAFLDKLKQNKPKKRKAQPVVVKAVRKGACQTFVPCRLHQQLLLLKRHPSPGILVHLYSDAHMCIFFGICHGQNQKSHQEEVP